MKHKTLNCAVIGLGIGEQHAIALLDHPSVKLTALCDLDDQKTNNFLTKYHLGKNLKRNFTDILDDKNIDVVSIASFDDDHFDQVMACLEQHKHVFVEKPLCQTEEQLKQIHSLWKKSGSALSSNLILRKAPLYHWLQEAILSGELGSIYAIDMDYLYGRVHKITEGWRANVENYSVMAGGGIHLVDLMMRFVNQRPVKVQSCVNKIATQGTTFRYPDFHAATFTFDSGLLGRITANFGCMHRHHHIVRIFGTKATFIYDDMGPRIHSTRDENVSAEPVTLSPKPISKGLLLLDFIESILSDNHIENAKAEFDLMCAIVAADAAINCDNAPIDIAYLSHSSK